MTNAVSAVQMRDFCQFASGGTPSKSNAEYWNGDIPWVSPKDMQHDFIDDAQDHISAEAIDGSATRLVSPGTILVVVRSGILARRVPIAIARREVAFNQDIKAIVVDANRALPEFVAYFIRAREAAILANGVKKGATVHSIVSDFLEDMSLPLPSLAEQRRIIEILDRASAIQRLRAAAQAKASEVVPALFVYMFGDPATNPKGWAVETVGGILESAEYGLSVKADGNSSDLPMLRMGNVTIDGDLSLDDLKYVDLSPEIRRQFSLKTGDILFNRTNSKELVGKTGLWDGRFEAVFASYFIRLRTNEQLILPTVLHAYLNGSYMKRRLFATARGAIGQANINAKELRAFPMYVPPIALQREFAKRIAALDGVRKLSDDATDLANSAQASLLNRLLGGLIP